MNTDTFENVTTTENEETDFTFADILAFINVMAELFLHYVLGHASPSDEFHVKRQWPYISPVASPRNKVFTL